ncbi:hypothetical protein KQH94_00385, partial [Vibrio cholerae]|nr:hypothetical protein [Vibrio cholerae]
DGGSAALVKKDAKNGEILGSAIITDGSFHEDVRIPAGGSKQVASYDTVENRQHYIDVIDPNSMKERLDPISIPNFDKVIREKKKKRVN